MNGVCDWRVQRERREHQATVDRLTAENDQLRLEVNKLQPHFAICPFCYHGNRDRLPSALPASQQQQQVHFISY